MFTLVWFQQLKNVAQKLLILEVELHASPLLQFHPLESIFELGEDSTLGFFVTCSVSISISEAFGSVLLHHVSFFIGVGIAMLEDNDSNSPEITNISLTCSHVS